MCACVPVHAVCAHMHKRICIHMSVCVRQIEVRRQLTGVDCFFPGSQGLNSSLATGVFTYQAISPSPINIFSNKSRILLIKPSSHTPSELL